jgi:diaminohydroxyphosphoribosylaminopyrimidine deaminase/5-amino-6-(5-phosphoribosylamino)uracil reductase
MEQSVDSAAERFMDRALCLAAKGTGRTSPNPAVGAVIVRDGEVVGEGYHARAGEDHAEIAALRDAGDAARGATLYVTLEPCSHHGKTPPCADAVVAAGITRVVVAQTDPNELVAGRGLERLRDAGIEVETGVREKEARRLNEAHIKFCETGLPFVYFKYAMSLDGKVATRTRDARWVTGEDARRRVHELRDVVDAIMVGSGTVRADDPALTTRLEEGGHDPVRVVISSTADLDPECQVFGSESVSPTWLVVGKDCDTERLRPFDRPGTEILKCSTADGGIDLRETLRLLGERDIRTVLIEGGPTLAASALEAGLVDKVLCFVAPILVGGDTAPTPVGGNGVDRMADALRLVDVGIEVCGDDVLIHGYLNRDRQCLQA